MPSIKQQNKGYFKRKAHIAMALLCGTFLVACGGSGETDRISPPKDKEPDNQIEPKKISLTAKIPMQMVNAQLSIKLAEENKTLIEDKKFNGFELEFTDLDFNDVRGKIIAVELKGDDQTYMFDPIVNKFEPFKGKMHYIGQINNQTQTVLITPVTEAIYQRTITRSNQFNYDNPDLSLITSKHINKATTEIYTVVQDAFRGTEKIIPHFSNSTSITNLMSKNNMPVYTNLYIGMGYMNLMRQKFPDTQNSFLDLANSLGTDLRDGHLDGRTILGDETPFKKLVTAPKNTDIQNNSYIKIGDFQRTTREEFGEALKQATLDYYTNIANMKNIDPEGFNHINKIVFIDKSRPAVDILGKYRWRGAGDYRPAIGLNHVDSCSNGANPCRQGLNVDDLETYVNDVEYLIGEHTLQQCKIHFYPSGKVTITEGDKVYESSLNRDLSDNLQQMNNDLTHYTLNVGASENKPAYFLQFELKNMVITQARTGYNFDIYSTSIETPEMDCAD